MGRVVAWTRSEEAAAERAAALLARLTEHQQAEARAARELPALLADRLSAGETSLVAEALRRWAGGDSALELARWLAP